MGQLAAPGAFARPDALAVSLQTRFILSGEAAAQENRIFAAESIITAAQDKQIQLKPYYRRARRLKTATAQRDLVSTMAMPH